MPLVRAPEPKKRVQTIYVGFDFGTSTTKVIVRRRGDEEGRLLRIDEPPAAFPWFSSPSLVRVSAGRAYFGSEADRISDGTLLRSLKIHLLPPSDLLGSPPGSPFPAETSPDLLVAAYLSWSFRRIADQLRRWYRKTPLRLQLNLAAPMNHYEDEALKARYLRIVQAAWQSVFGEDEYEVEQAVDLRTLQEWFGPWLREDTRIEDRATRLFEVLPETVAPLVSLSLDPRAPHGFYMIVDMGAGTTEISVNRVSDAGYGERILCFADESNRLGAEDFDAFGSDDSHDAGKLLHHFVKLFKRVWARGYLKEASNPTCAREWRELTVLFTGGGAMRPSVQRAVASNPPMYAWPSLETTYRVRWHTPAAVDLGRGRRPREDNLLSLLSVAHGLSMPRQVWPRFFPPGEIPDQEGWAPAEEVRKPGLLDDG